jgi:hypothetical protein
MARNTAFAFFLLGSVCIAGCGGSSSGGGSGSGGSGGGGGGTQKTTPAISAWPTASAITYGQTLASSTLTGGTASVSGTFAWTTPSTAPSAGTPSESVFFTPTDTTDYNTVAGSVTVTVSKATPAVSAWPTASAITYGQTLASSTLTGGMASVPGTFAWTSPSTVPATGTDSEGVTFTPTDATDYATVAGSTSVSVGKATPAITWANPAAITYGTALSGTQLNATANTAGTFTYTPASGIVLKAGAQTLSTTFAPTDTTDYSTATKSVQIVVNQATPTVSAWPTASAITSGQTLASSTLTGGTASVPGTFLWTTPATVPPLGTDSEGVTFTPTDAVDYAPVTANVQIVVNPAVPNVTGISPNVIYLMGVSSQSLIPDVILTGTGFASGDTLDEEAGISTVISSELLSSTQAEIGLAFGSNGYSPGWLTFAVCQNSNDTGCGTSQTIAFLGELNDLAVTSSGSLLYYDQSQGNTGSTPNGIVHIYNSSGVQTNQCNVGVWNSIAVDNKTSYMLINENVYNMSGSGCGFNGAPILNLPVNQQVIAVAADNGYAGLVQTSNNSASFYDLTGGANSQPTAATTQSGALGTEPVAIAMGTFGTETDAFVLSVGGTPSLYQVNASNANAGEQPALTLPGVTPISAMPNYYTGGWHVAVFDSGPAEGTIAVLSTYDQLLLLVNKSTWTVAQSVALSGTPFRIAANTADGTVIVAYANPSNLTTTYASVDALTGAVTPLINTSSLLSVGLGVSADGTELYSGQRSQLSVIPNQ